MIIVKSRVELWKQIWSWPVVGVVLSLILGAGLTFMTSNHSWLADAFFLISGTLLLAKFLTWEEARQLDAPKRRNSYGIAIGLTFLVLIVAIAGNHWINPIRSAPLSALPNPLPSSPVGSQAERKVEGIPKAGVNGTPIQSPQEHFPEKQPNPTKVQEQTSAKRHENVPQNNVSGNSNVVGKSNQVNSPAAPIQINSAPNGIAIGGGTVVNPTVNNNYIGQTKPDRTVTEADRINIVAYLSRIKATVSLKAPLGDKEATNYAILWYGIFKDAHWIMKDQIVLAYMTVGGNPQPGAILYVKGEPTGKETQVPNTDPIAYVATALKSQNVPIFLQRDLNQEEGVVTIQFGPRPD